LSFKTELTFRTSIALYKHDLIAQVKKSPKLGPMRFIFVGLEMDEHDLNICIVYVFVSMCI